MIFPRVTGQFLSRFVPHKLSVKALDLAWHNGYAWGFTESSICWLSVLVLLLVVVLAIRSRR